MRSDHIIDILFIIEGIGQVFVYGPECLEAVDQGLVGVGVEGGARSLQPYQLSKEGNAL